MSGKDDLSTLLTVNSLAELYREQGRYSEAEPLYKRALEGNERVLGKNDLDTLAVLNNLALLYTEQGRFRDAEPLFKRALESNERTRGGENLATIRSIQYLATLYDSQGRYREAEPLYKRAMEVRERVLGKEHPDTLVSVNGLALAYAEQGRYAEAEPLFKRALDANEHVLGNENPQTIVSVNNLATLYVNQGRHADAEPLIRRALEVGERVLGKEHPSTLLHVNNLAELYTAQGRFGEAELLYKRAMEAGERLLGKEHPYTLLIINNLAALYFMQGDWAHAAQLWRDSTAVIAALTQRGMQSNGKVLTGMKKGEAEQHGDQFVALIKTVYRLAPEGAGPNEKASRETFQAAQWAQSSEAATSLAQMAARGASRNIRLAAQVRERQDLLAEWQKRDGLRDRRLGLPTDKREAQAEAENNARLSAIDTRIKDIDAELAAKFPDYAAFVSPAPLSVEEVQGTLGLDEALVLFLDTPAAPPTPEETFIWVVTKKEMRWVRSNVGSAALARELRALRCGLDAAAWEGTQCSELTGQSYTKNDQDTGKPLPFDLVRAHKLYQALFGQVEELIKGKHLLLVPAGALTQLPFQVLVTASPERGSKAAAWLIRDHALTVLPAVSSLKALRRVARPSAATRPMIGFGNPLLDGDPTDEIDRHRAQLSREKQRCPETLWRRLTSLVGWRRGVSQITTRGGLADTAFERQQPPLPETADELCAVAKDLRAPADDIYLGKRATEREVKRLSASGDLANYRILHLATHGALSGQMKGDAEPGLLLTPPESPSDEDDGYLTASEIAGLKLDADWVILSACNTAAGGAKDAEALSGLARAFIYAQARALLVSHWAVDSGATVKLVTGAMGRLAANKAMGRAEAMRQSMLALINKSGPEAHPAFWAPFVVVGEGAARR